MLNVILLAEWVCCIVWQTQHRYKTRLLLYCNYVMGGDFINMRYTEREFDYEHTSVYDFVRMVFVLVLIAPARLCGEISSKVIYLKRKQIEQILLTSLVINAVIVLGECVVKIYNGNLDIMVGTFPVCAKILSAVVICGIFAIFKFCDFVIYKQLEHLLPIVTKANFSTTSKSEPEESFVTNDHSEFSIGALDALADAVTEQGFIEPEFTPLTEDSLKDSASIVHTLQNVNVPKDTPDGSVVGSKEFSGGKPPVEEKTAAVAENANLINADLYEDVSVIAYQKGLNTMVSDMQTMGIEYSGNLTAEEINTIEHNIDESMDPSKYLDTAILNAFLGNASFDSFGTIETFSSWEVPANFGMLA